MKYHKRESDSVKYLENVLKTWKSFCQSHILFCNAIKDVLDENKRLKKLLKESKI